LGDEKKTDDLDDASGGPENGAVTNAGCDGLNGLDGGEIDERDLPGRRRRQEPILNDGY